MPATAQQLIEAAYSRSTANDPGKLATDGELLGILNRVYQAYYALMAAAAPDRAMARSALVALAGSPAATTLPTDVIDLRRVENAAGAKVNVIPVEEKDRGWHLAPAVYRQGGSLISRGQAGDPIATDVLTLWHLDAPTALTTLASTIDARYPARFEELLVVELAMYLATKDSGRDAGEFAALKTFRDMQVEAFFRLSGLSMTALQSPHGGVIVQRLNALIGSGAGSN